MKWYLCIVLNQAKTAEPIEIILCKEMANKSSSNINIHIFPFRFLTTFQHQSKTLYLFVSVQIEQVNSGICAYSNIANLTYI